MKSADEHELLESVLVEVDPLVSQAGVLVELTRCGEQNTPCRSGPGHRQQALLEFTSTDPQLARELFLSETGDQRGPRPWKSSTM